MIFLNYLISFVNISNFPALHGGLDVLDLTQLSQHEELNSIELRLSNKAILGLLTDQLNGVQRLKTDFHVFKLANNGIRTLEKFINLYGFSINVIDLRHNQIVDVVEFFSLKHLEIEEIYLAGNEVATYGNYRDKIFDIMHSLKIVDGQSKIAPETAAKLEAFKKSVASVAKSNSLGKIIVSILTSLLKFSI